MRMIGFTVVAVALAASGFFAGYGTVKIAEAEETVASSARETVIFAQTRQQLQLRGTQPKPLAPRRSIQGGIGGLTALSGTVKADFCCKSGQGSAGTSCGQFDPEEANCNQFILHCSGSWSCQPGGSSCECL